MIDLAKRRDTSEANREALDPQDSMLGFRSVLAATIGNMLEFYDFVTFSFLRLRSGTLSFRSKINTRA
jgi:hypothetical protein